MTRKPKYPHVIEDIEIIIDRLLHEEITKADIAAEYKVPYHTIGAYIKKAATVTQRGIIADRAFIISGRKRRGVANNPSGGGRVQSKIKAFAKIHTDPLSVVRHKIVRTRVANKSKLTTYEVQTKGPDGKWYTIDHPTCEDAAVLLLGRLYSYDLISQADYNEQESV